MFDYNKIDTGMVKNESDEHLLLRIKTLDLVRSPGYGLIAELCKRLESRRGANVLAAH